MSESFEFVPRTGLSRTLHYRSYMKRTYWLSWVFATLSAFSGLGYITSCYRENAPVNWFLAILLFPVIPLLLGLFARFYLRLFIHTVVHLKPDGITEEKPWSSTEIPFADIESVKIWDVPYLGGHFRFIMKNGQSPVLTVALERSEYILEAIQAARPGLFPMESFLKLRRKAIMIDHSWARIKDRFRTDRKRLLLLFVALPIFGFFAMLPFFQPPSLDLETLFWNCLNVFVSVVAINSAVGIGCWLVADITLFYWTGGVLKKFPDRVRRDLVTEQRAYHYVTLSHVVLFVGILGGLALTMLMH